MRVPRNTRTQRPIPDEKIHRAKCVRIIEYGTQTSMWSDEPKKAKKVRLTFELLETSEVFNEDKGPQPCVVSNQYTASLNTNSHLYNMLKSWNKGAIKAMEESGEDGLDLNVFLGKPCMIQIEHSDPSKDGIVYANIANKGRSVMPRDKSEKDNKVWKDGTHNPKVLFEFDPWDQKKFDDLYEFEQNAIKKSDEYQAMLADGDVSESTSKEEAAPVDDEGSFPPDEKKEEKADEKKEETVEEDEGF